jgi:hypothetical protein
MMQPGHIKWVSKREYEGITGKTHMKMYLKYILFVVIGLLILGLLSLAGCDSPTVKQAFMTDIDPNAPINTHLLKVSESWAKEYGTSQESVLKYNVVAAWAFAQKALEQIVELEKRVKFVEESYALKPEKVWESVMSDPNQMELKVIDNFGKELK